MSAPRRFTYQAFVELPTDADLLRHVDRQHHAVLQFPASSQSAKSELIRKLKERLPESYSVFDSGGSSNLTWITIKEVVSRRELEAIENELIVAARIFRHTACSLAHEWADYNGVQASELWESLSHLRPFPGNWSMYHHGGHQCFSNKVTGQVVEVSLWFGGEFGTLDPQFFHRFLRTSPDLRCPPELQDDFHDPARALSFLEERGLLKRINGIFNSVGVFAPDAKQGESCLLTGHKLNNLMPISFQSPRRSTLTFARNMKRQAWLRASFGLLGVLIGVALVFDKQSSELAIWNLTFCLLIPMPIVVLILMLAQKWKILMHFLLLPALLGFIAFQCFNWFYWPSDLRFSFGSPLGASGSFHAVQFYHKNADQWIEGPEVEGLPMRVTLPDLNSDGYKDIRVVEENSHRGDAIEFVYLPNAKDGIHWKTHRMDSRLSATYKPAGISHNNP